jgi:hypothetical protein
MRMSIAKTARHNSNQQLPSNLKLFFLRNCEKIMKGTIVKLYVFAAVRISLAKFA